MSIWKRLKRWLGIDVYDPVSGKPVQHVEPEWQTNPVAMPRTDWTENAPVKLTDPLVAYRDHPMLDPEQREAEMKRLGTPDNPVVLPKPVLEESTHEWVTKRLQAAGKPKSGWAPNDVNNPGFDIVATGRRGSKAFAAGYSMRYLGDLTRRAERRDMSLTVDELMVIRSRGLV